MGHRGAVKVTSYSCYRLVLTVHFGHETSKCDATGTRARARRRHRQGGRLPHWRWRCFACRPFPTPTLLFLLTAPRLSLPPLPVTRVGVWVGVCGGVSSCGCASPSFRPVSTLLSVLCCTRATAQKPVAGKEGRASCCGVVSRKRCPCILLVSNPRPLSPGCFH